MATPPIPAATLGYTGAIDAAAQNVFVFDGSASITQTSFDFPQGSATIVFWINAASTAGAGVLLSYGGDPGSNPNSFWLKNPGNLQAGVGQVSTVATGINCADGNWHQIAVTLNQVSANAIAVGIYVDGVLAWTAQNAIDSANGVQIAALGDLVLGQGISGVTGLSAQMSEFQLWPQALSAQAVMTGLQVRAASGSGPVIVWSLISAQHAGTIQGGSFVVSNPPLLFRNSRTLTAAWTVANPPAGITYNLQATSSDNAYHAPQTGITTTSATVPGIQTNVQYTAVVQSVVSGTVSSWSTPVYATTLDLGQPQPAFITAAAPPFLLSWPTIDQAQQYQLTFLKNGSTPVAPSGVQPGNQVDVSALIQDASSTYTFRIAATAAGAVSPGSPSQAVSQPQITFTFTNSSTNSGQMLASWTSADGAAQRYLQVTKQTGGPTTVTASVLAGSTLSSVISITPVAGDNYQAILRPLAPGNIGQCTNPVTAIIHFFNGPVIGTVTSIPASNTMTVPWSFQAPPNVTVSYDLELWNSDQTQLLASIVPATSPQVIQNSNIVQGANLSLRIRAYADNSYGLWSQWTAVSVGGVPKVLGVTASVDIYGNITVNWLSVLEQNSALQGVTYSVKLTGPNVNYTAPATSQLTTILLKTNTNVQANTAYNVTVTASAAGPVTGPPSDPYTVQVGQVSPYPPGNSGTSSDPINLAFGAFLYQNDDLAINGVVPLTFTTCYSSARPTSSQNPIYPNVGLGNRWTHRYATALRPDAQGQYIYLLWGLGGVERYLIPPSVTGVYTNAGAAQGSTLVLGSNMVYTLTRADQSVYTFDTNGNLTNIADTHGNQVTLTYTNQQLHTVTDIQSQNTLTLTYSATTLSVTDGTRTITYTLSQNSLTFTDARGHNRTFNYVVGSASLIATIIDFSGVTAVQNTYNGEGQVSFQQDARALASHATYGTTLTYTPTTVGDGVAGVTTAMTDRMGNQSTYSSVAANGNLLNETYNLNATQIYGLVRTYDGFNNILSSAEYRGASSGHTPGAGNTVNCTYDNAGNLLTAITLFATGRIAALTCIYDSANNLHTQAYYEGPQQGYTAGMGNVTTWQYYADNTVKSMAPPLGGAVSYQYLPGSVHGLLQTMTDVLGNHWSFTYWPNGLLKTINDPYGNVTTYQWDALGRLQQKQVAGPGSALLQTIVDAYNENNQVTTVTVWYNGQTQQQAFVTQALYDNNGNLQTLTDPSNVTATYGYDQNNNRTSLTWPPFQQINRTTIWAYDHNDFLNGTTWSAANPSVAATYINDALGFRAQTTDPMAFVYTYNSAMPAQGSAPFPQTTTKAWPALADGSSASESKTYDPLGRLTSFVDRKGNTTTINWGMQTDSATSTLQQVITVTLPPAAPGSNSYTQQTVFDAVGRIVQFTDENSKSWNWTYTITASGGTNLMVATCTDPNGNQAILSTDSYGRIVTEKIGGGTTWLERQFTYDAMGRLTQVVESDGTTTNTATTQYGYGYDAASGCFTVTIGRTGQGNLTTGVAVQYFNGRGDLVKEVNPNGQTEQKTYAPWSSLSGYTNGRNQSFTYGFDAAGRRNSVTQPGNVVLSYTLDNDGNRRATQVPGSQGINCTFDNWNRFSTRTDAAGRTVGYLYWPNDQLKTLTYPDGKTVGYVYDGLSRLKTVTDWAQRATTYTYSPTGLLAGINFQGANAATIASSTFTFDSAGRATGYIHNSASFTLAQLSYVLNPIGEPGTATAVLPLSPTLPSAPTTFTYANGNQIATINGVNQAVDGDGNYLGPTGAPPVFVYDAYNRVTGYNADSYTYDLDGLRTGTTVAGVSQSYAFDVNAWQSPQVERGDPVRAVVEAVGTPTSTGADSWLPVYSGSQFPLPLQIASDRLLVVYDSSGNVVSRYVHGMGLIGGEDNTGYYAVSVSDFTGNVLARVGQDGAVTNRYAYDAYGASLAKVGTAFNPFSYNGRDGVLDDGNGLLNMRARSYMPTQLRFLQPDYLVGGKRDPQTLNRYAFATGNPVQGNDPLGLSKLALGLGLGLGFGIPILAGLGTLVYAYSGWFGASVAAGAGVDVGANAIEMQQLVQNGRPSEPLDDDAPGNNSESSGSEDAPGQDRPMPYDPPPIILRSAAQTSLRSGVRYRGPQTPRQLTVELETKKDI